MSMGGSGHRSPPWPMAARLGAPQQRIVSRASIRDRISGTLCRQSLLDRFGPALLAPGASPREVTSTSRFRSASVSVPVLRVRSIASYSWQGGAGSRGKGSSIPKSLRSACQEHVARCCFHASPFHSFTVAASSGDKGRGFFFLPLVDEAGLRAASRPSFSTVG